MTPSTSWSSCCWCLPGSTPFSPGRLPSRRNGWASCRRPARGNRSGSGFLLLGLFPGDIATSVAVGAYLSNHGDPWWHVLPFLALTLLLLGLPAILVLALGQRGQTLLPKVRDWMKDNSWVISEIVIVFFILITASSLSS
jgi:hypothetical protein